MTDDLQKRRAVLLDELRAVERALAGDDNGPGAAEPASQPWQRQASEAPEYVVLLDRQLRLRYVNRVQPGVEHAVGRSIFDFIPEPHQASVRAGANQAMGGGGPQHLELDGTGPDGELSRYSIWFVPMERDRSDCPLLVIASDISHRRRIEQELEEERSILQSLVANAPDHIMVVDRGHCAQFANRVELGFRQEDVIGKPVETLVAAEHREALHAAIEAVFETGEGRGVRLLVQAPRGFRWFNSRIGPVVRGGRVEQASLLSTDVHAQVQLEETRQRERESLAQSEARFRTLVEHASEAMVIFDVDTGLFVDVNPNACALFGIPRRELLQKGLLDLSPATQPDGADSKRTINARLRQVLSGEHPAFEWTHLNAVGEAIPTEVRLTRLPHAERRLVRGSVIDITERKQAEQERERLTTDLLQAQKMQAIGQLTGGIAHDFNNLLTVITSSIELIELGPEDEAHVLTHARHALDASNRAAGLTRRLLAFARRQPLRPRNVNISKLVSGTESLLRRTLGEAIEIETVLGGGLWSCEADPAQLENVILNLAINARDAMPDGGRLTIETANARLDREYANAHSEVEPGQYVMLAVTDNGKGMPAEVLTQAFEPFFTTKAAGQGSGLGLSMVYGFVKQSGGHVKIYSEPGEGTTVRIYLPRAHAVEEVVGVPLAGTHAPEGDGHLLLVVEDEASVREVVVHMLERLGYRTLSAADADAALALLTQHPDISLVVSDVVLPGSMNGAALAQRAQTQKPDLKVLFMSGYTENAIIHNGRLDPGVSLLEKPFTQRELAMAVREALHLNNSEDDPG